MTACERHNIYIYIYIFVESTIYCVPPAVLSRRIQPLRIDLCAVAALPFLMGWMMRQVWRTAKTECRWLYTKRISDI